MSAQPSPAVDRSPQTKRRKLSPLDDQDGEDNGRVSPPPPVDTASLLQTSYVSPLLTDHHFHHHHHRRDSSEPKEESTSNPEPVAASPSKSTSYCYRHDPNNSRCWRQMDKKAMDDLQRDVQMLPESNQQTLAQFWSTFSAAPTSLRNLMLRGLLSQCCFPQLSYIASAIDNLIRIDFLASLPNEIALQILSYLDTKSLCNAAQVSRLWNYLADDDVVWHRMCEQHIDRKCRKCGWGIPLLYRKKLRSYQQRSSQVTPESTATSSENPGPVSAPNSAANAPARYRPWKEVYRDRFKVGINWKRGRCLVTRFMGHQSNVMCLQFEDNILATGSYDRTIKIWDTDNLQEIRTLHGHESGVRCLQFDDTKLISGSLDCLIKVWNWRTGECLSTFGHHDGGVFSLHLESTLLASGSADNTVRVWNFIDKSVRTLRGHTEYVNSVKLDTRSRTVFSASDDLTACLWDLDTCQVIQTYIGHTGQVQQVLPLPCEFEFEENDAEDTELQTVTPTALDPQSLSQTTNNATTTHPVTPAVDADASSPSPIYDRVFRNGRPEPPRYMLTAAHDSTMRLWEVPTARCLRTFFGHIEGLWAIAANTLRIVSGSQDQMAKVWDPRTGNCERTFTGHTGPINCIGLSDSRFATGSDDCEVRMYDFRV